MWIVLCKCKLCVFDIINLVLEEEEELGIIFIEGEENTKDMLPTWLSPMMATSIQGWQHE